MARVVYGERVGKLGRLAVRCSATILDPTKQRVLLICRADNGRWAVPGGYMEPGESVAEACAREVREETGLHVRVGRLIAVYSTPHKLLEYPDGNRYQLVVLHFVAEPIGGVLGAGDETTEIGREATGKAKAKARARIATPRGKARKEKEASESTKSGLCRPH